MYTYSIGKYCIICIIYYYNMRSGRLNTHERRRRLLSSRHLIIDVAHAKTVTNRTARGVVIIQNSPHRCISYTIFMYCVWVFFSYFFKNQYKWIFLQWFHTKRISCHWIYEFRIFYTYLYTVYFIVYRDSLLLMIMFEFQTDRRWALNGHGLLLQCLRMIRV